VTRILSIPTLIVVLLLTSCALPHGAPRASTIMTSTPTHVAELNKQARPLKTCSSDVWPSFPSEEVVTPTGEYGADKLVPDVEHHQEATRGGDDDSGELEVATPTPELPVFTPSLNAYCRSGPGTTHNSVSLAMEGRAYQVEARSPDGTWYLIRVSATAACWVFSGTGSSSGNISGIRVVQPSPTPASAPPPPEASCAQFTTRQTCAQHPECTWNRLVSPAVCQPR
jgi:hypothetical protein